MPTVPYVPHIESPYGYAGLEAWRQLKAAFDQGASLETTPAEYPLVHTRVRNYARAHHPEYQLRGNQAFGLLRLELRASPLPPVPDRDGTLSDPKRRYLSVPGAESPE